MPKEFFYDGFLEDYYDGELTVVNIIKKQEQRLKDSH